MQSKNTIARTGILLKCLLLVCLLCGAFLPACAQRIAPVGTWTPYVSHNFPRDIIKQGDRLYVRTDGGVFWHNVITGDYQTYSPVEGLTSVAPTAFYLDTLSGVFFLGYEDGSIDYFTDPDQGFSYITDIRRTELFTNKRINDFDSRDGLLYIATEFGIVIFDVNKKEVRSSVTKIGTSSTGRGVKSIEIIQDTVWVTMGDDGLWQADINVPNITVPGVWSKAQGQLGLPAGGPAYLLAQLGDRVYVEIGDTIFQKDPYQPWLRGPFPSRPYQNMGSSGTNFLWICFDNLLRVYYEDPNGVKQYNFVHNAQFQCAYLQDTLTYYVGDSANGLMQWYHEDTSNVVLTPPGPFNNLVTQLAVGNGELFIAPQGREGTGPASNADGFYSFSQQRGWRRFNVDDELGRGPDSVFMDFARCHYDLESRRCYLGSWQHGVVMVEDNEIRGVWTSNNSNLPSSTPNDTRVSGLALDRDGNLWVTVYLADYNLNVLTPDNVWVNLQLPGASPFDLLIDDYGNKWVMGNGNGLTVFNENGTLTDTADDLSKRLTADAGNGGLPNNSVLSFAKDRRGQIWIGTLEGVAVFANPGGVFSGSFPDASCPVIEGFCLLRDQRVSAIAVDGANRKWIGTNNGVYVVNPQGNRLLYHYTTENSPIFDDEIRDIRIDQGSGEIFIGTGKGLISLMGDATGGKENSDSMYVFPNPIPYDYEGTVAITSTVTDAEVRITNTAGQLVRQLDALGGQAVWDFRDVAGRRLAPGIYIAMVANTDGKLAGAAKFVVLERP